MLVTMKFVKAIPPKLLKDRYGLYTGGNRTGWHGDMDRCWIDNEANICVCSRLIRTKFGTVEHVTISKGTGSSDGSGEVTWAEKMQIKNELFGENRFAVEVFPKTKNLVDVCDVYHLWVFDKKLDMPFGIALKEYQPSINRGYNITDADLRHLAEDYERTGKDKWEVTCCGGEAKLGHKETIEFTLKSPLTEEQFNLITDAEFEHTYRIWFDTPKGKHVEFVKAQQWIPCSERLPKDDGEYLVWMQWDFEEEPSYSIVNYDANAEAFGEWHEYFDSDTLGSLGSDFRSFKGVFAWMPLPEPYKGES